MRFTKKFICNFIYNNNAIEGISHPEDQIELAYDMVKKPKVKVDRNFLYQRPEIFNTLEALEFVRTRKDQKPTMYDILELHKMTTKRLMPDKDVGRFRAFRVTVGGHEVAPAHTIHQKLNEMLERWDDGLTVEFPSDLYPSGIIVPGDEDLDRKVGIIEAEDFPTEMIRHIMFEQIHPFSDGNGRTGRLLYLWDCLYHKKKFHMIEYELRHVYYAMINLYRMCLQHTLEVQFEQQKKKGK